MAGIGRLGQTGLLGLCQIGAVAVVAAAGLFSGLLHADQPLPVAQAAISAAQPKAAASAAKKPITAEDKPVVTVVLRSVDEGFGDLKFIFDVAGKPQSWTKLNNDLLSVFTAGLDTKAVLGYRGYVVDDQFRSITSLPVSSADDFTKLFLSNLSGMDIKSTLVPREADVYSAKMGKEQLGFIRYDAAGKQAVMGETLGDVKGIKALLPEEVLGTDDLVALVDSSGQSPESRLKAMQRLKTELLAGTTQQKNEAPADFAIRKQATEQNLAEIERFLVESARIRLSWTTSEKERRAIGNIRLTALDGTSLAASVAQLGSRNSDFSGIPMEPALLHGSVNFPIDSLRKNHILEGLKLWRPRALELIAAKKTDTENERAIAQELSILGFDILEGLANIETFDGFIRITDAGAGNATTVGALKVADGARIVAAVKKIAELQGGDVIKVGIEEFSGVTIHSVMLAEQRKTYPELLGPTGMVFVGTTPTAVWYAAGDNALEKLKATITVAQSATPKPTPAIEVKSTVALFARILEARVADKLDKGMKNNLKIFITGLAGGKDEYYFKLDRDGESAVVTGYVDEGILRAVGLVMANEVDQQL